MDYQDFRETWPYCVYYYFDTKLVVAKDKDGRCIYEGLLVTDTDCKTAFRAFSCPSPKCYMKHPGYLQSYLYVENKPIFKNGKLNKRRMAEYERRKEILMHFLVNNVRATKPSFMH